MAAAYDTGVLKVIVATCSLAAGINLPARRVILHGARMGADFVDPSMLSVLFLMMRTIAKFSVVKCVAEREEKAKMKLGKHTCAVKSLIWGR